jgi:hypothetical protein
MPAKSDPISTNINHGMAPFVRGYKGKIIYFPKSRTETVENIEATKVLRDLLHSENFSGAAMTDPTREEIKAEIGAAEARTDTKIERLGGKIDVLATTVVGKIESLKDDVFKSDQYNHGTRSALISTFVVGVLALAGLLVAVVTYGDTIFGRGMVVRDVVQTVFKEQQEIQKRDTIQPRH